MPLRLRREHRDWTNAEHAAWLDLFLASFEVEGRFDSLDVARAYLGPRAAALDALLSRGAFIEFQGTWSLSDYLELYDGRRPRHYRTLAQRLPTPTPERLEARLCSQSNGGLGGRRGRTPNGRNRKAKGIRNRKAKGIEQTLAQRWPTLAPRPPVILAPSAAPAHSCSRKASAVGS